MRLFDWIFKDRPTLGPHIEIVLGDAPELHSGVYATVDHANPDVLLQFLQRGHRHAQWLVTGFESVPWSRRERRRFVRTMHRSRTVFWSVRRGERKLLNSSTIALNIVSNDG